LNDEFPRLLGTSVFDLHTKHLLYGKIDKDGDAIYLDDSNLKQLRGVGTHLAVDFVCKAFSDLGDSIKSAADKGFVSKNNIYPNNLKAHKSWTHGDLEFRYNQYLNKLYTTFVNSYLSVDRRADKIKNYKDFVKEFLRYILRIAKSFPMTKTGFITSIHCSPFVSGLMLEVAPERHGLQNDGRVLDYIEDRRNFLFFVNEVKKYGFMVDKNAPWRIVFNIASGRKVKEDTGVLSGAQLYMDKYAVSYDNIFETYYRKAYLDELLNLKNKLYTLYNAFYLQFSTYETLEQITDNNDRCRAIKLVNEHKDREPPPIVTGSEKEVNEYWLKILLKLRMVETNTHHTPHNFNFYITETIDQARLFSLEAGLRHINELTKGSHVTNFLSKGSFFYGLSQEEYERRKLKIIEAAAAPSMVNYSLTGTKNIK
jgi:hypothetical protein